MKKLFLILLVLFISTYGKVFSQDTIKPKNDFKIGIYSTSYMTTNPNHCCDTNNQPHSEPLWSSIYPTSYLNVLREDGFNIAIDYFPNIYTTKPLFMRKLLELFKNNNMQYIPHLRTFYRPDTVFNQGTYPYYAYPNIIEDDTNIYDFSPYPDDSNCTARPNLDKLIKEVYSDPNLKDVIWGYYMTEEASYQHFFNPTDFFHPDWNRVTPFNINTEVPPIMVSKAIEHFRQLNDSLGLEKK